MLPTIKDAVLTAAAELRSRYGDAKQLDLADLFQKLNRAGYSETESFSPSLFELTRADLKRLGLDLQQQFVVLQGRLNALEGQRAVLKERRHGDEDGGRPGVFAGCYAFVNSLLTPGLFVGAGGTAASLHEGRRELNMELYEARRRVRATRAQLKAVVHELQSSKV